MTVKPHNQDKARRARGNNSGFSLVESLVGMGLIGVVMVALYSAISTGLFNMRMARENLRATQILLQKTETIRLCNWTQISSNGYVPASFVVAYDPQSTNSGITYTGAVSIVNAVSGVPYSNDLKQVTITLNWVSGKLARQRAMSTYVARYGIQSFID